MCGFFHLGFCLFFLYVWVFFIWDFVHFSYMCGFFFYLGFCLYLLYVWVFSLGVLFVFLICVGFFHLGFCSFFLYVWVFFLFRILFVFVICVGFFLFRILFVFVICVGFLFSGSPHIIESVSVLEFTKMDLPKFALIKIVIHWPVYSCWKGDFNP